MMGAAFLFCFVFSMGVAPPPVQSESILTIGTGDVTGVFYQTGGAISRIVNKKRKDYGIRFVVESTDGSVYNINSVLSGNLDFGLAQSDRQYQAAYGGAEWLKKPQRELRSIFSLYPEACTLCVAEDSGVRSISDLKGKRVNLGNLGSGHRQNSIDALTAAGIDYKKDIYAESFKASEAPRLLKKGKIDAFFYTVGHPTGAIINAISGRKKVRIIPMPQVAKKLTNDYTYYVRTRIPVKYYRGAVNKTDIDTFGVKATLITSARVPEIAAYAITKEIFENFRYLKTLHVAFLKLKKEKMLENLEARIHRGAVKYYKEIGLMK